MPQPRSLPHPRGPRSRTPAQSQPPSRSGELWRHAARPPAPGCHGDPQYSTGTPLPLSRPLITSSVGDSGLAQTTAASHSADQCSAHLPCPPNCPDPNQIQRSPYNNAGLFNQARDFTVMGTFVDGNVTYNNAPLNQFMKDLLEETIRGAEFDSSDRDPPPRCLPGTRLAVLQRCLDFISTCDGSKKMRWVVGAAGVGKSAIMQSVAESPDLPIRRPASVFFSINGRDDASKAIPTLSYQLAVKFHPYRQIIEQEITDDPSLLRSSMAKQFNKLIVEPFVHNSQLKSAGRVLVIIDGLDECKDRRLQLELLRLISDLCFTYPSSPLVWLIASRPEPHITSFFSKPNVIPAYEKEEIPVNSDEARTDVERFLRAKFMEIKENSDSLDPRWPEERDFWRVANAAGGLFAYAHTVIRYIGDLSIGSPSSQLSDVLYVIDKHPTTDLSREEHPMALLDALYERILSKVPPKIMINTRKLLLALASCWDVTWHVGDIETNFILLCNWLGMTADDAYAAVNHLRSVLDVPRRDRAHRQRLKAFHKSFIDYIQDLTRSSFFPDFFGEVHRLNAECTFRILNYVPNGIRLHRSEVDFNSGTLASGPVTRDKILLTWTVEETDGLYDNKTRLNLYELAIDEILNGLSRRDPSFRSLVCIRFLTAAWSAYPLKFPYNEVHDMVFDETRRLEFIEYNILMPIPLRDIPIRGLVRRCPVNLQFRHPPGTVTSLSDPRISFCKHDGIIKREAGRMCSWMTTFSGNDCLACFRRFQHQLENWKTGSTDAALILFTSTDQCCVQVRLVDPDDVSEWTYSFWCSIPWVDRKKLGSAV